MRLLISILAVLTLASCTKEGVGGASLISGKVMKKIITTKGDSVETVPAIDKNVFIIYGDETYYNDDVKSDITGHFEFPFLEKGSYELFAYSDCLDCPEGKKTSSTSITVERGEDVEVELIVEKIVDYDDGSSTISGVLMEQEYVGTFPVNVPFASQENEVYITYGDDEVYFDRMDTGFDGKYEFKELIKGVYTVYAYSKCGSCINVMDTVSFQIEIENNNTSIFADTLTIEMRQ
jgi:hypothetical protein